MLTPTRQLQHDIERRYAIAVDQHQRARAQTRALRHCWHATLARPRNLALSFAAGATYGLLRRSQVKLPGRVDLWQLARPLLVSTAMAWWTQHHAEEGAADAVRDAQVGGY